MVTSIIIFLTLTVSDKKANSFLNVMFQNNFKPCITEPTRITNTNKPSLVDNIFINSFDDPVCGNILEHISYDHLPNFIIINHEHTKKKSQEKKRDKKNFNPTTFQSELLDEGMLLLELMKASLAESSYNIFSCAEQCSKSCFPSVCLCLCVCVSVCARTPKLPVRFQ